MGATPRGFEPHSVHLHHLRRSFGLRRGLLLDGQVRKRRRERDALLHRDLPDQLGGDLGVHGGARLLTHHLAHEGSVHGEVLVGLCEVVHNLRKGTRVHRGQRFLHILVHLFDFLRVLHHQSSYLHLGGHDLHLTGELIKLVYLVLLRDQEVCLCVGEFAIVLVDKSRNLISQLGYVFLQSPGLVLELFTSKLQLHSLVSQIHFAHFLL
eukprot:XP_001705233.1 Hypothetical protein GL50803_24946 [Giardia lamblia ATCC 50803]